MTDCTDCRYIYQKETAGQSLFFVEIQQMRKCLICRSKREDKNIFFREIMILKNIIPDLHRLCYDGFEGGCHGTILLSGPAG